MIYEAKWHDSEQTILHLKLKGLESWGDLHAVFDSTDAILDTVDYAVSVIIEVTGFPKDLASPHLRAVMNRMPKKVDLSVVVIQQNRANAQLLKVLINVVMRMTGQARPITFADSVDEALEKIAAHQRQIQETNVQNA